MELCQGSVSVGPSRRLRLGLQLLVFLFFLLASHAVADYCPGTLMVNFFNEDNAKVFAYDGNGNGIVANLALSNHWTSVSLPPGNYAYCWSLTGSLASSWKSATCPPTIFPSSLSICYLCDGCAGVNYTTCATPPTSGYSPLNFTTANCHPSPSPAPSPSSSASGSPSSSPPPSSSTSSSTSASASSSKSSSTSPSSSLSTSPSTSSSTSASASSSTSTSSSTSSSTSPSSSLSTSPSTSPSSSLSTSSSTSPSSSPSTSPSPSPSSSSSPSASPLASTSTSPSSSPSSSPSPSPCPAGYGNCDGNGANGCETFFGSVETCGDSCSNYTFCPGVNNTAGGPTCTGGPDTFECGYSCSPGYGNCNDGATVIIPDPANSAFLFFGQGDQSVTIDDVIFSTQSNISDGNFFLIGTGFSGSPPVLSSQQDTFGLDNIMITFPLPTHNFELHYGTFAGSNVIFTLSNGDTFTQGSTGSGYVVPDFAQFTSSGSEFISVLVTTPDTVMNIGNVTFGDNDCETFFGNVEKCGDSCSNYTSCPGVNNTAGGPTCTGGPNSFECGYNCISPWNDCNTNITDGCEVDFSDSSTCGSVCGETVDCPPSSNCTMTATDSYQCTS